MNRTWKTMARMMAAVSHQAPASTELRDCLLKDRCPKLKKPFFSIRTKAKRKSEMWVLWPTFLPRFMSITCHLVLMVQSVLIACQQYRLIQAMTCCYWKQPGIPGISWPSMQRSSISFWSCIFLAKTRHFFHSRSRNKENDFSYQLLSPSHQEKAINT